MKPRQYSTEKALAASIEANRLRRENPELKRGLKVFITRGAGRKTYGWEIRRFGGVVLEKGEASFRTEAEAHADGSRILAERSASVSRPDEQEVTEVRRKA